ncbi:MAG: hypothetical protein UE295_06050 [Acutalibacteraceae bacterium]|nr:hypothetical protein [Acutalibacteraceae bacterium]
MTRKINRIKPFLNQIEKYWEKAPDFRFGQLIVNVLDYSEKDPFFLEEDEFLNLFETFFNPVKRKEAEERIEKTQKERSERMKKEQKKMAIRSVLRAFDLPDDEDKVKRIEAKLEAMSKRQKGGKK